jgi:hypothetical protein
MHKPEYLWNLDGRTLSWRRTDKDGNVKVHSREKTEIQEYSFFLKFHFQIIKGSNNRELADLKKQDVTEFEPRAEAVYHALKFLARHFDLQCVVLKRPLHLMWLAKTKGKGDGKPSELNPLTEWRILDCTHTNRPAQQALVVAKWLREKAKHHERSRFKRMEKHSEAMMRDAIVLFRDADDWSLVPGLAKKVAHDE